MKRVERSQETADQVQMMAGFGLTELEISKVVGMSTPTLHKYYMAELENGHVVANMKVAQSLFRMATDPVKPNVAAAIFWAKARMRWREYEEEHGKKEVAELLGRVAHQGSNWEKLLR
jgi:hypothetical protein